MVLNTFSLLVIAVIIALISWSLYRDGNQNDEHKRYTLARQLCVRCGYSVHVHQGCCPDCGEPIDESDEA